MMALLLAEHMAAVCGREVGSSAHTMERVAVHYRSQHEEEQEGLFERVEEERDRIESAPGEVGSEEVRDEADTVREDSQGRGNRRDTARNVQVVCSQGLMAKLLEDIQACSLEAHAGTDMDVLQVEPKSMIRSSVLV
jgi:hypothetical protein